MKSCFASDNTAGICPEVLQAWAEANAGFTPSYGDDLFTDKAAALFREIFETSCEVFFVFNGTAANSLALASLCQSYHSVIAHEKSHVETDECGAPEFFSNGTKLLLCSGENGKLNLKDIEKTITKRSDIHYPRSKVVSLTQSTEVGTVYSLDEVRAICDLAKKYSLKVHMDGARFANAVVSLKQKPADMTWRAGVDVMCFGGTKMGMGVGEAIVFFDAKLAEEFDYRCKQAGQLAAKMRFLAASWIAMLKDNLWLRYAENANRCAFLMAQKLSQIPGIKVLYPPQANAVFAEMPDCAHQKLRECGWSYYTFIGGGARFMCSWQNTEQEVEELVKDIGSA